MSGAASKIVLVTGASGGIGAATALRPSGDGHHVVLGARRVEPLAALRADHQEETMRSPIVPEALEMTTFRLVAGLTSADFVAANADIDAYLRRQPGFRWRRITEDADGTIVDLVAWDSAADGERSAEGIMTEMAGSPVHATIDQSTVAFRIVPVVHHVTPPADA